MVKGASGAIGIRSMLEDMGVTASIELRTDASVATGIVSRTGIGKVRHIEVAQLWLQERVRNGDICVRKVHADENLADAFY